MEYLGYNIVHVYNHGVPRVQYSTCVQSWSTSGTIMEYLGHNHGVPRAQYIYAFYEHCHRGGLHMINQPAPCCQNWAKSSLADQLSYSQILYSVLKLRT